MRCGDFQSTEIYSVFCAPVRADAVEIHGSVTQVALSRLPRRHPTFTRVCGKRRSVSSEVSENPSFIVGRQRGSLRCTMPWSRGVLFDQAVAEPPRIPVRVDSFPYGILSYGWPAVSYTCRSSKVHDFPYTERTLDKPKFRYTERAADIGG